MKRLLVASCAVFVFGLLSCLLAAAPERQFKFISPRGEWNTTTNGGPQVAAFSGMVRLTFSPTNWQILWGLLRSATSR